MIGKTADYFNSIPQKDKKKPGVKYLQDVLKSILSGYSQIFFSTKWYVGLIFFAATFIVPSQGAAGIFALILSNLWAWILGFPKKQIRQGYFAYNGLLTGLALGMTYVINAPFLIMLFIATLLGVLIAASLRSIFEQYLFIPVLSAPFVLTTWLVLAGGRQFTGLIYTIDPFEVQIFSGLIPYYPDIFIRSLGASFFQLSILSGFIVTAGVLIYSRYAFFLALTGLVSGTFVYTFLSGNPADISIGLIGFNFALTAIAVGGIWTVPGPESFILAAVSGTACALTAAASLFLLNPLGLPVLAFPFVATSGLIIYALKHRGVASRLKTVLSPEETPERNLKQHKNRVARFVTGEIPAFALPVRGQFTITQGVNDKLTHKNSWAHAWDFEILDNKGMATQKQGLIPDDFYSFNMPVVAPADGKVVTIANHIEDNPIGAINHEHNWGNTIIIWHYGSIYSSLSHLKKNSVKVKEGDIIRQGQTLGKIGNSGHSPIPHLHFQVQLSPEIGAPTIPAELMHYTSMLNGEAVYHTHGCPVKGDRVAPLDAESRVFDTVSFPAGRAWKFKASHLGKEWDEEWETDIDLSGNRYLLSKARASRVRFFINKQVLLLLDYNGPRNTGLSWFFMGLPRLPMTTGKVRWQDELPGDLMLAKPQRIIFDLLEPFFSPVRLSSASHFSNENNRIVIETILNCTNVLTLNRNREIKIVSTFEQNKGLLSLMVWTDRKTHFQLERKVINKI